ncbi:MAG: hypothetical protein C0404_03415 [Verrucomicrobia bacterium]|nr:hypothetical protein [Verrucomicrobiota bacterium]
MCGLGSAIALGPHEVLVLINENSADSAEIAASFVKLRQVPEQNVVKVRLPDTVTNSHARISADDFTNLIWNPANKAMKDRGLDGHILAWVYSSGFPVMVLTDPPMSLQGATFVRNVRPEPEKILKGTYVSPVCGGFGRDGYMPRSFDSIRDILREDMPLPSMMLGYTGERGNTKEQVLKCIERGVASDFSAPTGTVYFVTSKDVRSQCREWEFPAVKKELSSKGVQSVITGEFPVAGKGIAGLMMGLAAVEPGKDNVYLPGSMAEHLTSAAAMFGSPDQTKLSVWIGAGAAASCGTVVEPMSIWAKFPHARFFVHYAAGCTMMESFFQSVQCPLELLIVGEPLARPWAPRAELTLSGLEKERVAGTISVRAAVDSKGSDLYGSYMYLVDGRVAGLKQQLELDTRTLKDGPHLLRCVAYRSAPVKVQVFKEVKFVVANQAEKK